MKKILYLTVKAKLRSLGKYCFLPSLADRMIRMSNDEGMGKNKRINVLEGSRVEIRPK